MRFVWFWPALILGAQRPHLEFLVVGSRSNPVDSFTFALRKRCVWTQTTWATAANSPSQLGLVGYTLRRVCDWTLVHLHRPRDTYSQHPIDSGSSTPSTGGQDAFSWDGINNLKWTLTANPSRQLDGPDQSPCCFQNHVLSISYMQTQGFTIPTDCLSCPRDPLAGGINFLSLLWKVETEGVGGQVPDPHIVRGRGRSRLFDFKVCIYSIRNHHSCGF